MSKISRTVRGGEEVARNVRKGCRTLDEEEEGMDSSSGLPWVMYGLVWFIYV
jgi:hypothetical protein